MKRLRLRSTLLILVSQFLIFINCGAQETPMINNMDKQAIVSKLENLIPDLMDKAIIPGLSIAVIKEGQVLWHKDFGVLNAQTGDPVVENTVFQAASLTKSFFAYQVMKMVEKGELDFETPLINYLPKEKIETFLTHSLDMEGFRKDWLDKITIPMVLSHSSGFAHGYLGVATPYPLRFEPGTKYEYSGDGYGFLSTVIQHLRGESLDEIMRKDIIEPLKMKNSYMIWQARFEGKAAAGHDMFAETEGDVYKFSTANSSAGLSTTAEDYAKFIAAIINDNNIKHQTVLKMLTPQIELGKGVKWSSGFGIDSTRFGSSFWHTGDFGVFRHFAVGFKEQKAGFVLLTNSNNGLSIAQELYNHIIGNEKSPGITYQGYDTYDSANIRLVRMIVKEGVENAKILYNELRENNPESVIDKEISSLAYKLMNSLKFFEAIEILKESLKYNQESVTLYSALASAYLRNGNDDFAIEKYKKVLELKPDSKVAERYVGLIKLTQILVNDGFNKGIEFYTELKEKAPDVYTEQNISSYGIRLLRAQRVGESIEIFTLNLKYNKESSNANLDLGDAYAAKGEKELARKYILEALEISPGNGWAKMSLDRLNEKK